MELSIERAYLLTRLGTIDQELSALEHSINVVDPTWTPPKKLRRPAKGTRLPRGAVAQCCLEFLRLRGPLWTHELAKLIAARYRMTFDDRRAELDFASAVAMALRRYERRGLLNILERDQKTAALRWSLRPELFGNVVPLRATG
jgi:hypothetical protein